MKTPMEILPEFQARTGWNEHSEMTLLSLFIFSRENYLEDEFRAFLEEQARDEESYDEDEDDDCYDEEWEWLP